LRADLDHLARWDAEVAIGGHGVALQITEDRLGDAPHAPFTAGEEGLAAEVVGDLGLDEAYAVLKGDALEDGVLMGCDEAQLREVLAGIIAGLVNPYRK